MKNLKHYQFVGEFGANPEHVYFECYAPSLEDAKDLAVHNRTDFRRVYKVIVK